MSSLSEQFLAGFVAEARGRVETVRHVMSRPEEALAPETLADIVHKMQALAGSATMLELHQVAVVATPLAAELESSDPNTSLSREHILTALDEIDMELNALSPSAAAAAVPPVSMPRPELPAGLLEIFAQEASEHITAIQTHLEQVRSTPDDTTPLREIRRAAHTLKGASASVGIDQMASMAHLMEDLLEEHLEKDAPLSEAAITWLFDAVDLIEAMTRVGDHHERLAAMESRYGPLMVEAENTAPRIAAPITDRDEVTTISDNMLRLPLATVDGFMNSVGEVVINRSSLERYVTHLRDLLVELEYSTKRLKRAATSIDSEIEFTSQRGSDTAPAVDALFDSLEMDRYSQLYQLTRELEEAAADAGNAKEGLLRLTQEIDGALARERRLTTELQDGLMRTRLVAFREIENRLRQTVRRTSQDLNKPVDLLLTGFETVVDKTILFHLADPLMHLLRNAIDHGIEAPHVREASGKPAAGTISIRARRDRGRVIVTLSDDGAGVDYSRVRRRAVELGIIAADETTSDERLTTVLFEDGFSSAETVTQTSGRGVGLNIVRRAVRDLQGIIRLDSTPGQGTTFTLSMPISLAVTTALYLECGGQLFAVSTEQVGAVLRLPSDVLSGTIENDALRYEGRLYSLFDMASFVGIPSEADQRYGVVVESGDRSTVVLVDGLAGIRETVMKSLGTHLKRVHGVHGATIGGDGRIIPILDLIEVMGLEPSKISLQPRLVTRTHSDQLTVLVVDDSLSVRTVVSSTLERAGYRTITAKDGIEALERLDGYLPDAALIDIEMPRMNGYELLSRIRSAPETRLLPVVFLTSRSSDKHRSRADELGADGYLVKPYRDDELIAELTRVMERVR